MTDPWQTPEREALRSLVADFTAGELRPHLAEWEASGEVPRRMHRELADVGLLGVGFPEPVGGSGGNGIDSAIVTEQIIASGGSSGLCAAFFTHGIALPHMVAENDPEKVERYVRPTLAGERIGALAVSEPDGGSDVAALRTSAVADGEHYVVNGTKTFITSGARADFVTLAARTGGSGASGISLLVVDADAAGFQVVRKLDKMGWHCSDTAELAFVDVRVPRRNLIGPAGGGFGQLAEHFAAERLGLATHAHAVAARCLTLTVEWARQREVFGQRLIEKQVVRHRLAEMATSVEIARSFTHRVIERRAAGEPVLVEAAMAKNAAVVTCSSVVDQAVQLHGGFGYLRDAEVERHYRDARILGIGGGSTEVLTGLIAKGLGY